MIYHHISYFNFCISYSHQIWATSRRFLRLQDILCRFAEWSTACWLFQRQHLLGSSDGMDLRFLSLYHNDDAAYMKATHDGLVGRAMKTRWDDCAEAGPKSRQSNGFQEDPPSANSQDHTVVSLGNIYIWILWDLWSCGGFVELLCPWLSHVIPCYPILFSETLVNHAGPWSSQDSRHAAWEIQLQLHWWSQEDAGPVGWWNHGDHGLEKFHHFSSLFITLHHFSSLFITLKILENIW